MSQCASTAQRIATVTRYATIARKQVVRAERAMEIAGPLLRPEFEGKLLGLLAECNSSAQELIDTFNSGILDRLDDAQLANQADGLMKIHFVVQVLLKGCATLQFRRKVEFKTTLDALSGICDRIGSIREGIELALNEEFCSSLSSAVKELHHPAPLPVS
jgi:hypothetical protein